jgi:hypothetical protein
MVMVPVLAVDDVFGEVGETLIYCGAVPLVVSP